MWWQLQKVAYWEGLSSSGESLNGIKTTNEFSLVRLQLKRQNITVTHISYTWRLTRIQALIKEQEIAFLTCQLGNLLHAGFPLIKAFEALISQYASNSRIPSLLIHLKTQLESGIAISTALREYPEHFNALYCNLIATSEYCGNLADQLIHLADYQEQLLAIKHQLKKALYYPIALLSAAIIVLILLILFVVPQFEILFKEVQATLPLLTRLLIRCANWLKNYQSIFLMSQLILGTSIILFKQNFFKWIISLEHIFMKIPWIKTILQKVALTRFCHTLSTTLLAGLPMIEALAATAEVVRYSPYKLAILKARRAMIENGVYLSHALEGTDCFPVLIIQMIETGQNTSQLPQHLKKLAHFFDKQLNDLIEITRGALEPFLLIVIGVFIGSLLLAFYWPIFELGNMIELI